MVVYLTRLPSHGRETARYLRSIKATRDIPILFVDGGEEAIERTMRAVPDALFTTSDRLQTALANLSAAGGVR